MKCPCCNQAVTRADHMIVDLRTGRVAFGDKTVELRGQRIEIVQVLWENYPQTVPAERIVARLNGRYQDHTSIGSLKVMIHHVRRALADMPLAIETYPGFGYRLAMGDEVVR